MLLPRKQYRLTAVFLTGIFLMAAAVMVRSEMRDADCVRSGGVVNHSRHHMSCDDGRASLLREE